MENLNTYFNSLSDESLEVRHAAVDKIAAAGRAAPEQIVPIVIAEISSAAPDKRWYLGRALVRMEPGIIPIILEYAEIEQSMDIQKYYGAVLASFGEDAVPSLISLFSSTNPTARGMASAALERLETRAVPALIEAANSRDPQVKLCAELTLAKLQIFEY